MTVGRKQERYCFPFGWIGRYHVDCELRHIRPHTYHRLITKRGTRSPKSWNLTSRFPSHNRSTLQMLNKPKICSGLCIDLSGHHIAALLTCLWQCCCCRSPSRRQGRCGAAWSCWCPKERAGTPWGWRSGWPGWTRCSPRSSPAPAASLCSGWATNAAALPPGPWQCAAPRLCPLQGRCSHPAEVRANSLSLTKL